VQVERVRGVKRLHGIQQRHRDMQRDRWGKLPALPAADPAGLGLATEQ